MNEHLTIDHRLKQGKRGQDMSASKAPKVKGLVEDTGGVATAFKHEGKSRTLIVISTQLTATMRDEIAVGKQPRRDHDLLQEALNADAIYPDDLQASLLGRFIRRFFGSRLAVAWLAFRRHRSYDYILSDTEGVGLPLALLMKLSGTRPGRPRHTLIAQYLSPFKKRIFFRLGVGSHLDTICVHSSAQRALAINVLRMPGERMLMLPMHVDLQFWGLLTSSTTSSDTSTVMGQRPKIFAAGLERRDYPTLLAAVRDLDVDVHIAAASAASFHRAIADRRPLSGPARLSSIPSNVFVKRCNYEEMRDYYAAARFVVVPVIETDDSAGLTVILEAMAMAKAVIVSGTRGQTDVIRDPRNEGRGPVVREWWPGFVDNPDVAETLGRLSTGFYVTPGDPNELRIMIQYLLDHPEVAEELGSNGRRVVEEYFSVEAWALRYAAAIRGEQQPAMVATCQTTN